jgi:hypothetical protein
MDALIAIIAIPFLMYFIFYYIVQFVKSIFKEDITKELNTPPGMKLIKDIKKNGGKYSGYITIEYNPKIKKSFPVEAKDEEELMKKYQEIINKFRF